jgi:hypothetical protein
MRGYMAGEPRLFCAEFRYLCYLKGGLGGEPPFYSKMARDTATGSERQQAPCAD